MQILGIEKVKGEGEEEHRVFRVRTEAGSPYSG